MSVLSPDVFSSKQTCSENRYYMYIINYAMVFNKFYFQKISKFSCAGVRLRERHPHRKHLRTAPAHNITAMMTFH